MKNNLSTESKVDAALSSLNHIQRANPSPYFTAKVLAKINNARVTVWDTWSAFFLRPTIAFATICFVLVINAFVLYSTLSSNHSATDNTQVALSNEYNETLIASYDIENEKP